MKTYTSYRNSFGKLSNNSSTDNLILADELINDALRIYTARYYVNETTITDTTVASQSSYNLPFNFKSLITLTINVGTTRYVLTEITDRPKWDALNFIPYTSDIPQFFFIYDKKAHIFPTPASSGNTITWSYKQRIKDLSQADYTAGTVTATNASKTVTGSGTTFTNEMAGRWLRVTTTTSDPTGSGEWYQIATVESATSLTLRNNYTAETVSGASYVIGEVPLLPEDYQDLPLHRALFIYFTARVPDATRAQLFASLMKDGEERLSAEYGSKSASVSITPRDIEITNPNLYVRNMS